MAAQPAHILQMYDMQAAAEEAFRKREYEKAAKLHVEASLIGEYICGKFKHWVMLPASPPDPEYLFEKNVCTRTYSKTQNELEFAWLDEQFEIPGKTDGSRNYYCKRFHFRFFKDGAHQYLTFEILPNYGANDEGCFEEIN